MNSHHDRVARWFATPGVLWAGMSLLLVLPAWSADPSPGKPAQPRVVNTPGLYLSSQVVEAATPRTINTDPLYLSSSASATAGTSGPGAVVITTDALYLNAKPSSGNR